MNDVDYVVVGGGMAGLAAAYHLRDRGSVVLLEADVCGSARGSSYGESRMYREMYSDRFLCERAREANHLWAQMESEHGVTLRSQHGLLFYGEPFDEETIEGSIPGAARVMDEMGIPYESLTAAQIAERWPIVPKPDHVGLFEPTAGALLADRALDVMKTVATQAGVRVLEKHPVATIEPARRGVTLLHRGPREEVRWHAQRVVVAAGGWANRLLAPLGVKLPTRLWSMLWAHYRVDERLDYPQWFCFQRPREDNDDGGLYYGFPRLSNVDGAPAVKVGIDWAPDEMRSDDMATFRTEAAEHLVTLLDAFISANVVGAGPRLETWCSPYSMSPDANFIIDRVSGDERIAFFTGGSGQAFKFAPLVGRYLADLAVGRPVTHRPWALDRFAAAA